MIMMVAVILMEMQRQHASMGFAEHMHDRGVIGMGERNRRAENAKRIGRDHHGRTPTPQAQCQTVPHPFRLNQIGDGRQELPRMHKAKDRGEDPIVVVSACLRTI
jgi:hypothetical protein